MSEEVLEKIEMTEAQARDLVAHVVTQRLRWGKQYQADDIGLRNMLDALLVLAFADNVEATELRKSLSTANRQLAAAGAREAKYRKEIEELRKTKD